MSTKQSPVVIASFEDQGKAKEISGILQDAGFLSNQIWLVSPDEQVELNRLIIELRGMGISEEEIHYYEDAFRAGHSIVSVRHEGQHWQAVAILYEDKMQHYMQWSKNQKGSAQEILTSKNASTARPYNNETLSQEGKLSALEKLLRDAGFDHLL